MRGCRNLTDLSFDCVDWAGCIVSEIWRDLPDPPPDTIRRGTRGVFEFVKGILCGKIEMHGTVFELGCQRIDLSGSNLSEEELLPLLEMFKADGFFSLQELNLVTLFLRPLLSAAADHSFCCRAEMGSGTEAPC